MNIKWLSAGIAVTVLHTMTVTASSQQTLPARLVIEVKTDKKSYAVGEAIELTYSLRNVSAAWVAVDAQPFAFPPALLTVTDPEGRLVKSELTSPRQLASGQAPLPLRPAGFYGATFDLLDYFPTPYPIGHPHNLDAPGTYEIVGVYENRAENASNLWTGRVLSAPIKIEIKAPSPEQLKDIEQALRTGDETVKRRAVELILKTRLRQFLNEVAALLDSAASLELRREAARTLFELPDAKLYEVYLKHLKSPDGVISAHMALILGEKLKLKQAVPALIEAADLHRPPESYRSALRALIEIGDPRAIPAIRKIAENDPSETIRRYATEALQKLEAQTAK